MVGSPPIQRIRCGQASWASDAPSWPASHLRVRSAMTGLIHCVFVRGIFKTQNGAVTAAFFIAPVLPGIFIPLIGQWRFPPDVVDALLVYVIALPFVFAVGLPLFLLFSRMRIFSWWGSILGGAIGGVAIQALVGGRYNFHGFPLLLYAAVGAATGLAFGGLRQESRNGLERLGARIRKATQSHASESPVPGEHRTCERPGRRRRTGAGSVNGKKLDRAFPTATGMNMVRSPKRIIGVFTLSQEVTTDGVRKAS
jgi:hypothetical protein